MGNVILQVAGFVNCKLCIGIEKERLPARYGKEIIKQLKLNLKQKLKEFYLFILNLKAMHEEFGITMKWFGKRYSEVFSRLR